MNVPIEILDQTALELAEKFGLEHEEEIFNVLRENFNDYLELDRRKEKK